MRISELIKELERVKEMQGDLLVAIFTDENYYINPNLEVVNNTNTNLRNTLLLMKLIFWEYTKEV